MEYVAFVKEVEKEVRSLVEEERQEGEAAVQVRVVHLTGYNGMSSDAVTVMREGRNSSPMAYLQEYYDRVPVGETPQSAARKILSFIRENELSGQVDTSFLSDYENARKHLVCRLLNFAMNEDLLIDVPHRRFLDLAVVYCLQLSDGGREYASVLIRKKYMDLWHRSEEQLWEEAWRNMQELKPCEIIRMEDLVTELTQHAEESPLYVLTGKDRCYGAVWITQLQELERAADILGDRFYILPSSIHEVILLPASFHMKSEELREMVRSINGSVVSPEDVLSDSVYYYDGKELSIA